MSVVVNILAAIGLIVIISYLSVYLYNHIKNRQVKATVSKIYPPGDYMQNSGVKCWVFNKVFIFNDSMFFSNTSIPYCFLYKSSFVIFSIIYLNERKEI